MTPTARSLRWLKAKGFHAAIVERWNSFSKTRHDAFGVADLLCFNSRATYLVQCTTAANLAAREAKVRAWDGLADWLAGGRRILLHGWAKRGARGKRKVWEVTEREIRPEGAA